jgi:hypothetical protein
MLSGAALQEIRQTVLAESPLLREANFTAFHPRDLEFLFRAYDERFFAVLFQKVLAPAGTPVPAVAEDDADWRHNNAIVVTERRGESAMLSREKQPDGFW